MASRIRNQTSLFSLGRDENVDSSPAPEIAPLEPSPVYNTYWRFAVERQNIFFRRLEHTEPPWTTDPILLAHKFTNAYRASDRVSQYLIRNVIYRDDLPSSNNEIVFRILLFKLFNRIETWELLEKSIGSINFNDYSFKAYDKVLTKAMKRGESIYSGAYIMPSGGTLGYDRKHRNHLALIERMMADELPNRLAESDSMQKAFELIRAYPTIGDFLAYQYVTDINYSTVTNFSEMSFVVPGPGSLDGIKKCFISTGGLSNNEIIRFMADRQEIEFQRLGLDFKTLWGRRLQLIDCQNLFCEVDKYARVRHPDIGGISGRKKIKQKFYANLEQIDYWYPPKWKLNVLQSSHSLHSSQGKVIFHSTKGEDRMDLQEYQQRALKTDRNPINEQEGMMIPLLGLAGEAGSVLAEYKKHLRDGKTHTLFSERFAEELGDVLWYLANVASKFGLDLQEIARRNLAKCEHRWGEILPRKPFDEGFPQNERFPRRFMVDFMTTHDAKERPIVRAFYKNEPFGDHLTDNSEVRDGYSFHDAIHLAFAAVLGWSPLTRKLLGVKRKSDPIVDEVQDGARALYIEEGISAFIFAYLKSYDWLEGKASISSDILRMLRVVTENLEVGCCTEGEWEQALLQGFSVWREIRKRGSGTVIVNLDERTISLKD